MNSFNGFFYITKGQYRKNCGPSVEYKTKEGKVENLDIGGFNPYSENTVEWYGLYDTVNHRCWGCGNLNSVFSAIEKVVRKYKNRGKCVKSYKSDGYAVSVAQATLQQGIYEEFGDFMREEIEEKVNEVYEKIKDDTPFKRAKRMLKNKGLLIETVSTTF